MGDYKTSIHYWLRALYGRANHCENKKCDNDSKFFDWALIKSKKYTFNRNNFKMLCRRCHHKYDYDIRWKNNLKKGLKKFWKDPNNKLKILNYNKMRKFRRNGYVRD